MTLFLMECNGCILVSRKFLCVLLRFVVLVWLEVGKWSGRHETRWDEREQDEMGMAMEGYGDQTVNLLLLMIYIYWKI